MEAVRAFNNELSSLYETRPPVSRAKMASVTKHAIKAIKFYKHVVQSVEKFVQKCKPEYKVPGLYVIDSIVRQSRHQFGPEKDVFAPRFTKNIVSTFQNLFKCPPEEKCRVVRVLNLWQKNAVFPVEVIQPLLDLAAEPNNVDLVLAAQRAVEKVVSAHQRNSAMAGRTSNGAGEASLIAQQSEIVNTVTKLLEQTGEGNLLATAQEGQLQQLQLLQQQLMIHTEMMSSKPQAAPPVLDSNLLAQIKLLTDQLLSKTSDSPTPTSHNSLSTSAPSLPPLEGGSGGSYGGDGGGGGHSNSGITGANSGAAKQVPEPGFNRKLLDFDYGDSDDEEERKEEQPTVPQTLPGEVQSLLSDPSIMQRIQQMSASLQNPDQHQQHYAGGVSQDVLRKQHLEQQQQQFDKEISQNQYQNFDQREEQSDVIVVEDDGDERDHERDYDRDHRRSRRSRDRSRSPRRRRHSRSRSRERRRSRDRHRRSRSRDHEREQQREKERERKKRGLPTLKDKHVGICSRTLWFGHLAKHTTEDELRAAIEQYGTIDAINMIPPRGCAFVCMTRRKEAAKALDRLKGFKLNSSSLRVAWAPGIGVKESSFKDHWDVEQGVTYIPWSKLPADLSPFVEGGTVDEESLPEHLRGTRIGQDMDEDGDSRSAPQSESQTPQMTTPLANFTSMPGIPASQQLHMIPPHLMVPLPNQPPPRSIPPTSQIPPHSLGQMSLLGQSLPGQSAGPPQGLAATLQAPGGTPVMSATAPISLPSSVSHAQAVSVAASILGAGPNLSISIGTSIGAMDRPSGQLVGSSGMPGIGTGSPLLAPGPQQAAVLARPGFPPPGQLGAAGFGIPPNVPPRPGFPLPGQALRPPFQHLVEKEMDEPKEWPADDSILEEEALEELEQDTDHRMGIPPGLSSGAQGDGRGPAPLMSLPMMGMRMRLPGPGGPHRMGMPLPGIGGPTAPQPGMMVEVGQPGTAAAMAGLPVGAIGPGGMLGPRLMRPGGPQAMPGPEGAENMIRSPVPGLMGPQGAAAAMGLRLGMGNQGPRGIGPGNMAMGQRMPGLPGSPGLRGMGPGGGPIRIVLGNQQNPRPPGPGGMGVRPGGMGMDALRAPCMPGPRNVLEEMQGPGALRSVSGPGPSEGNGLLSPGPGGLLQGLMMGAALRGGRPGLLGLRPNMPMNSGFRFNPQQPMGINFRGLRPEFLRPPGVDKPLDGGADRLGLTLGGAFMGRSVENEEKSPEYGDGFEDEEDNRENLVPRDSDFRAVVDNDVSTNSDTRNSKAAAGSIGPDLAEMAKPRDRAGRQSRWSDVGSGDSGRPGDSHAETNGPAVAGELQSAAQDQAGLEAVTVNPMGGSQAVEGVAEG